MTSHTQVKRALMVAAASNGVIGRNNELPWHLPKDLQYFKQTTMGKPVVMGRKTFESIGRPLPGRTNIVVTRQTDYQADGIEVVNSLEEGLELAQRHAAEKHVDEIMVIGGAELYKQSLPTIERVYLTKVHAEVEGDAFFPELSSKWHCVSEEKHGACEKNPYDYSFCVFEPRHTA